MTQRLTDKPIVIATDHRGVELKEQLKAWLLASGYEVKDCGTDIANERVDAMDYAIRLASEIKVRRSDFAVGICGSGQMMAMTANRFPFLRATLLHTFLGAPALADRYAARRERLAKLDISKL